MNNYKGLQPRRACNVSRLSSKEETKRGERVIYILKIQSIVKRGYSCASPKGRGKSVRNRLLCEKQKRRGQGEGNSVKLDFVYI
jgi:hypothetical protein